MQSSVTGRWFAGQFQWIKCGLLFLGMTKNYMDRQVTGVLKGMLQHEFVWSEIDYSNLVFAFQAAYAIGMLAVGRFIDYASMRVGYAAAIAFWSLASMAHALGGALTGFMFVRSALGFGEAGVSAASIKAVTEWFLGLLIVVIYLISDVGSVAGGWLSSGLIKGGSRLTARESLRRSFPVSV